MALSNPGAVITQRLAGFEKLQCFFQALKGIIIPVITGDKEGEMGNMRNGHGVHPEMTVDDRRGSGGAVAAIRSAPHSPEECTMTAAAGTACSFIVPAIVERSLRDLIVY